MGRQKGTASDPHITEGSQLSCTTVCWLLVQKQKKMFHCGNVYLVINEYTETEAAWVGKIPVPYETIYLSLELVPFFCCCLSSCIISARQWVWMRRKESPMAAPLSKGRRKKKGKRKKENRWAWWDLSIIITFWLRGCLPKLNKAQKIYLRIPFLQLQSCSMNLCNLLNPLYPTYSVCKMKLGGVIL